MAVSVQAGHDRSGISLTRELAVILARPVEMEARCRAARHLLDWIACAVAGTASPVAAGLRAHAGRWGSGPATALGLGRRIDAHGAVLLNGGLGNVMEMDDVHRTALLHPGPVVIPAALALAQHLEAPGNAFLDAIVRGYEAMIRLGSSVGAGHYRHWHNTATCGPFGSAAAAASLLGLDIERTVWALGNAGTQMSGVWQCRHEAVMTKQLHTARASHAGLWAAELAAEDVTGPAQILEGPQGLFAAACPDARPDQLVSDPEGPWRIFAVSFKPWPACRHAHAAIDAALILRGRVDPDDIARLTVETYKDALTFCDRPQPSTTTDAKFSLQHAVAITLLDGPPPLSAFEPPAIQRPDVAEVRRLVSVQSVSRYEDAYPRRFGSALVAELRDGRTIRTEAPDALGDPENPLDDAGLVAKARSLFEWGGLDDKEAGRIISASMALAEGAWLEYLTGTLP